MPGANGSKDQRGLLGLTVPVHAETLAETLTVQAENPWLLPEVGRKITQLDDGSYQVDITFEGLQGTQSEETFEFDFSFGEEPLESHPNYKEIKITYGGYLEDGELKFPEIRPKADGGGTGLRGRSVSSRDKNPFFGAKTYLVSRAMFRHTYLDENVSPLLLSEINTTVDTVPGGFPTPAGRNWLIMPPKVRKRGNVYEIVREYLLSKPGERWPLELYKIFEA